MNASAEEEDGGALVDICVRTGGAGGSDASAMFARDPGILGERYALPYLRLEPELCAVAVESETGYIVGYAVATLDTGEFCARIQVDYLPGVRDRYPDPHQKPRADWTAEWELRETGELVKPVRLLPDGRLRVRGAGGERSLVADYLL